MDRVPRIDLSALRQPDQDPARVAEAAARIDAACRQIGFFAIVGHGIDPGLVARLHDQARSFFALADDEKRRMAMVHGGVAWRGWFPLGGELTSGRPDQKEGLYFGAELPVDDPRVQAGTPLHGPNLFPTRPPGLRDAVLEYLSALTELGHDLARGLALGLGLEASWFHDHLTADPLVLLRVFRYPPGELGPAAGWGVAEHTDYGLLTILAQDDAGGLEVRGPHGWVPVDPEPDAFVVNLGDMLERMTGGAYRSTPHRVRNRSGHDRLSIPFFFDPGWDAEVRTVPGLLDPGASADGADRWDGRSPLDGSGTYGRYLLAKVSRVFPELGARVVGPDEPRTET